MPRKYRVGFDISGLMIFLIIMIPNFVWFAVPAPNDVLRADSVTPVLDMTGSICQVIFVGLLCVLIRKEKKKLSLSPLIVSSAVCIAMYFTGWILYYCGITSPIVILLLTVPPCAAFMLFALDRKNTVAVVPIICFTVCHSVYGIVNFIV